MSKMPMFIHLKNYLARFRDATHGTVTVEAVIIVPILFWAVAATSEFFEMYRYKSIREKASYTVVDMISREQSSLTPTYIDNTKTLFDDFTNSTTQDQIRISVIIYNKDDDEYAIVWSQVRGTGPLKELTTDEIRTRHDILPIMGNGEHLIQVESYSKYHPALAVGFDKDIGVETRVFTSPRFAEQVKCIGC